MLVSLIAYEILAEVVHEAVRTIVDCDTSKAHIICVKNSMAKAYRLPLSNKLG